MKTGDPKKAAVLGAVALIVVGVAIFQVIPKPTKVATAEVARAEGQAVAATEKKTTEALPTTLTSQPFSKPKIPVAPATSSTPAPQRETKHVRTPGALGTVPYDVSGVAIDKEGLPGNGLADASAVPNSSDKSGLTGPAKGIHPGEIAGNSQQLKGAQLKVLTFNGVMDINGRTAMITIDDKPDDTRECKIGSKVAGFTVIDITPDTLILHRDKTTLRLTVGSSHSL